MGFWTIFAIVLSAASFTASYVQAKKAQKRAKRLQDEMAGVLVNKESNIEAIPVVYGERRVGGVRVYMTTSGDDRHEYLYVALVVSEGRVESISDLEIDEVPASDDRFLGLVSYEYKLGDDDQTTSTVLDDSLITVDDQDPNWEYQGIIVTNQAFVNNFRLRGVAYVAIRLKYDAEVFAGVPDFTVKVKGRRIYDPRKDSTSSHYDSSLGVSDHRATDDSTWDWSDNPALCLRDYLTNDRFGKGLDASDLDDTEFMQAADDIESFTVTPYSGGSSGHKLFSLNAVIDTNEQIFTNVEKILLSCRGFLPYTFGKYGLKIDQASSSVMTLDTSTIIGDINIVGSRKEDRFNQVIVKFPDANTRFQPNNVAWPNQSSDNPTSVSDGNGGYLTEAQLHAQFLAEDDELLVDEVDLDYCTDIYQARDLARIFLWRSRNALNVALQATSEAMELTVGDVVSITHPTPNWTAKKFQVDEMGINYDGTVTLKCVEYDSTIYAYDPAVEQEDAIDIIRGDPGNVQAPTNVTGTNTGSALLDDGTFHAVLNVSWTASQDATVIEYEVRYKLSSETPYKYLKTTDTTVRIEGMAPGTYNIGVRALDAFGGKSAFTAGSNVNTGIDTTVPGDITNTGVTAGIGNLVAFWDNPTDDDLKQIRVYVATTNTKPTNPTAVVTGEAYAVTNVVGSTTASRTRYFWLEAEDYSGNVGNTTASFSGVANQATGDDIGDGEVDTGNIADDAITATQIAANTITASEIQASSITVDKLSGDVSELFPTSYNEQLTLTNTNQNTVTFTLPAPQLSISKRIKVDLAFNYLFTNSSSSASTYVVFFSLQMKSKGATGVQVGATSGVYHVSYPHQYNQLVYIVGNHLSELDTNGRVGRDSSGAGLGSINGVYYDGYLNRTYILVGQTTAVFSTGDTLFYSPTGFTSTGTFYAPSSTQIIAIDVPANTTIRQRLIVSQTLGATTTATDFRGATRTTVTYSNTTIKLTNWSGTLELIS